ncbi:MAG: ABC transporter permease, partial [Desulfobacula sp.]|nr:ABC transporter permease [Desulfobacula sp.]
KRLTIDLIPSAIEKLEKTIKNTTSLKNNLQSGMAFNKLIKSKKIMTIISLHLSSHGNGIGAFNQGWLYDIKKTVNIFSPFVKLNATILEAGKNTAKKLGTDNILKDTLRPSLHRPWQSFFKDTPALGGEVSRLAAFLGFTFVTANDSRQFWNTPHDKKERMDIVNAAKQSLFISNLIAKMASSNDLSVSKLPRNGFATLEGNASFLRHGAVFADAPAPGSMILSYQGPGIFYNMVDESGNFFIKGISTKKLTLHKVILEGYKFDKMTGDTIWAVDKNKTTKARYRVKVRKNKMKTDLIMFRCNQTTILNLLEPRTFQYMTKMQILDARMDAKPVRYWYSRIDTRSSLISSIYMQPGTRLKLSLSDSILSKKFILTHASKNHPEGNGYRIDTTPLIAPTQYLAARDMWSMLNPRIDNLENKGINNQKIKTLQKEGNKALQDAEGYFKAMAYDNFFSASGNALALAGRVYDHVQSIQKDVLYGVLFYIMLFAPFAFCLERFLFAFINIYKRIAGFLCIMVVLITIIYNVHPAFELAYSPIVIILAFFIIGLSAMVTWIIFNRFENEMKRLHRQGRRGNEGEISFLKAFAASFFMGLNNLRRRRARTVLTCTTLIILTFTIMSFTSVKNIRQHSKLLYNSQAPYQGLLVKQINWKTLDERAFKIIENTMASNMIAAPRAWLDNANRTQSVKIPVISEKARFQANGLIGLSHQESKISSLSDQIMQGRWFTDKDQYSIIIPERMAKILKLPDLDSNKPGSNKADSIKSGSKNFYIKLWSIPFKVIGTFSGKDFDQFKDLDGEPITPAVFPDEIFQQTTETEMEALESGEDVKAFQSRYKHIPFDQTVIIPYKTLISLGGSLKSVALKYKNKPVNSDSTFQMVDRFGLWLFSGEKKGVFLYNASDSLNYSGLPNVLIPILISMFIVLNTMIGSVQERKREIEIYTSIGMAPSHVSIIFIAEALSYAVLSVVLGYILAQVVVTVFAGTSLLSGLTVNYSSLGGVFAMAMVMLVVILSSIYPSRVAASIAIPDVEKSWAMAKAKGNRLDIELPFLIKTEELPSVFGYLYELFDTHRAVSHGIFSVGRLKMDAQHNIKFTAWLAPFDLGVMQQVTFNVKKSPLFNNFNKKDTLTAPSKSVVKDSPSQAARGSFMEIDMTIVRQAGEHNTWWRVNKRFVNLIRKQLLIWRSMDDTEKQTFQNLMKSIEDKKGISIA